MDRRLAASLAMVAALVAATPSSAGEVKAGAGGKSTAACQAQPGGTGCAKAAPAAGGEASPQAISDQAAAGNLTQFLKKKPAKAQGNGQ